MTSRSALRLLVIPMAVLFALALALALAVGSAPAHAQLEPITDLLPGEEAPGDEDDDNGPDEDNGNVEPQVTEVPQGGVAAGGGGTSGASNGESTATPLFVIGAMTLAGAGVLAVRRRAATADSR